MSSYKCSNCDYISKTKGLIKKHIDNVLSCKGGTVIEDIIKVGCNLCGKEFDTEKFLSIHKNKCVEKKVIVERQYTNAEEFNERLKEFKNILIQCVKDIELLKNENKELKDRLERVETTKKKDTPTEIDTKEKCCYAKKIFINPKNYDYIQKECEAYHCEFTDNMSFVKKNNKDGEPEDGYIDNDYIEVGNTKYYYDTNKRKDILKTSELFIVVSNFCDNRAKFLSNDALFCNKHKYSKIDDDEVVED